MTKILIADDNNQNLYMLETLLKAHGYEVTSAWNGAEALASAKKNVPDLIVTDILMPEMDGFELCRRLKADELLQQIPVVIYTATYTDPKDEQLALSLGAERFIIKPQEPEFLVKIVEEILDKPAKGGQVSHQKTPGDETKVLQQYSEVLFRKLEKKVTQLEAEIAEHKRTENELRESQKKYHNLITQSPDGIFIVNLQGTYLAVNKIMCETLKYSEKEFLSMQIWDIVPEEYRELHKKRIADIRKGQIPKGAAEYVVKGKDGVLHYVEILSAPYYEGGKLVGFQGIARDTRERKKSEEALLKSFEQTKKTLNDAINTMVKIEEMRDPYTSGHQQRVTRLAVALAREMNFDDVHIENLRTSAVIHDIGKMYVPSDILSKPGKLTVMEFNMIKIHPQSGYDIVKSMDFPTGVAEAVLQHHERLDGSGYPAGLKGDEISREAKILAVADVVEAMASHRPYRPALGHNKALEEISINKGKLYDAEVVDTCLKLFNEKGFKFEISADAH